MKIDYLIKNGHIIDPANDIDRIGDIGVKDGKVLGIIDDVTDAATTIDASGHYVFPGFIDFHTHVYYRGSSNSVNPDIMLPMGVTTAVDAGSCGCTNFKSFYHSVVCQSDLRIFTHLNVCSYGQLGGNLQEDFDPGKFEFEKIKQLVKEYPHQILGLKIRMGEEVLDGRGLEPLKEAKKLATECGLPLIVHASNPPSPESELLSILSAGDVMAHCYHGKGPYTILDESGRVSAEVLKARERGIIFDCANGITNYNHKVAKLAIEDGFLPDVISTDLCEMCCNLNGHGKSLPYIMSKYLTLGMKLFDVVRAVTETPARLIGLAGQCGTLSAGAEADITICTLQPAAPMYLDNFAEEMQGDRMLLPLMTMKDGKILYRRADF